MCGPHEWLDVRSMGNDLLASWNVRATCNPQGAGKWSAGLNAFFRGADVVVIPDDDPQAKNSDGSPRFHPDHRPGLPAQLTGVTEK
jgi:hypothetical protein